MLHFNGSVVIKCAQSGRFCSHTQLLSHNPPRHHMTRLQTVKKKKNKAPFSCTASYDLGDDVLTWAGIMRLRFQESCDKSLEHHQQNLHPGFDPAERKPFKEPAQFTFNQWQCSLLGYFWKSGPACKWQNVLQQRTVVCSPLPLFLSTVLYLVL